MIDTQHNSNKITFSLERIMILVITIIMMMITFLIKFNESDPQLTFKILSIYGLVVFLWIVFSWHRLEKDFISIYIFFMIFSVLFYLGQPIAFLLGAEDSSLKVYSIKIYSYSILNETLVFVLISYMLIHIGGVIAKNKSIKIQRTNQKSQEYNHSMNLIGTILFFVSIIPTLILISNSIKAVLSNGYVGLFTSTNTIAVNSSLLGVAAGFFIPSLYMLLISNARNKRRTRLFTMIFFAYIIVVFMLGRRGENSIYLLGFILIWHNMIKPIKGKKLIRVIVFGVLMVFALAIISQIRAFLNTGNLGDVITNSILNNNSIGLIRDIFSEFGITLLVPATIIDKVPEVMPFYNGKTVLNFFLTLIPNIFWDTNPGLVDGTLEGLVTPFIRSGTVGGIGGSFLAEIYYNFGYYSYMFLPIYGAVLAKLGKLLNFENANTNKLKFYFSIYTFTNILWIIRSEILTSGKEILYFALFPTILIKFAESIKLNSRKEIYTKERIQK